jgi:uncharacterized membrane protein
MSERKSRGLVRQASQVRCGVCGREFTRSQTYPVEFIRPEIVADLEAKNPDWRQAGFICKSDLADARRRHVEGLLRAERGDLDVLERTVIDSLARHETTASNIEETFQQRVSFGERMADRVASFGGSWTFIMSFALVLVIWMAFNAMAIFSAERFDPFPFILLNLVLSCLAAIQAPLIMMSQRRLEAKDRLRAENDYKVNLRSELEIRQLHEKIDHLILKQWERLAEIQQVQMEIMEDLGRSRRT